MYAIVDIAGQQFKVEKNQKVFTHRLDEEEGKKVTFDQVLLIDNDGKVEVGTPTVKGMIVTAKIVQHLKGDKVKVFKKKRRKGYQKENGHRQYLTELLVEDIASGKKESPKKEKVEKKSVARKEEVKAETKTVSEKKATASKAKTTKPEAKKESKTTAKKPAVKKAAAKKPSTAKAATAKKESKKEENKDKE